MILHVFHINHFTYMDHLDNKRFYGSATVGERGQIVIPAEARRDFDIQPGDKLLVLADLEKGIVITKSNVVMTLLGGTLEGLRKLQAVAENRTGKRDMQKQYEPQEGDNDETPSS